MNNNYYCVILAGGIGSRLWPSSRQQKPKQFLDILGTGETLLQMTYKRFARFVNTENIIVMSNTQYAGFVRKQLPDLPAQNLLLEPMRRNTVPSVTWAAVEISHRNPDGCMVVTPADQVVVTQDIFEQDILQGLEYVAHNDRLLTLGVMPTRPETSYGYIQMADERGSNIFEVHTFTEKPSMEFARMFVDSGEFLWNTGLFIWRASTFLNSLHLQSDLFAEMMENVERKYLHGEDVHSLVAESFSKCANMSLEQGVLEKLENVDVMLCQFRWSDIGTWDALYDLMPKEKDTNVRLSDGIMLYDCEDCIVKLPSGKIAVVQGLKDYVVVEEDDVLVICKKDDQGAIRKFVNDVQINVGDQFV
mgnify:CR=1 FL=1